MKVASYEIRVRGPVHAMSPGDLAGLSVTTEPVETVLYGALPDKAALDGLLDRIEDLGLELVEVRCVEV